MTTHATRSETQPSAQQVYKMRDLSLHTAQVMKQINDSGRPALITLRGRFVAIITPLNDAELESKLISAALESGVSDTREFSERRPLSTEEAARELGVELQQYGDRDPSH